MPALGIHSNELDLPCWSSASLHEQTASADASTAGQTPSLDSTNGNDLTTCHATARGAIHYSSLNGNCSSNSTAATTSNSRDAMNGNTSERGALDNAVPRLSPQTPYLTRPCHNGVLATSASSAHTNGSCSSTSSSSSLPASKRTSAAAAASDASRAGKVNLNGVTHSQKISTAGSSSVGEASSIMRLRGSPQPQQGPAPEAGSPLQDPGVSSTGGGNSATATSVPPATCRSLRPSSQNTLLSDIAPFRTPFTPASYRGVSESAGAWGELGHYNLLHVTTQDAGQHWFTRYCCYLVHCSRLRVNFNYPLIKNKDVLNDQRIQTAMEQVVRESLAENKKSLTGKAWDAAYKKLLACQMDRAHSLLNNMKAAISVSLIRLTGYVLFKVFSRLLKSVVVHKGQLEAVQRAAKKGTPLIFLPLHRSHVDYLFVTWVLFNSQIPAPIVAAGDNLNMPVFGALLRGTGGFFIKRRLETSKARRDVLYRALLQCYMSHALHAGYNLEFFIEGGRTRTGKPAMPKGGLLSVILDAYLSGLLDDALLVPIAINYDKLVDGNFIREQLGQSKVPESFWGTVWSICKVLSTNYGQSRIDFGAPFSLKEFVQNSKVSVGHLMANVAATPPSSGGALSSQSTRGHHRSLSTPVTASLLSVRRQPATSAANTDTATVAADTAPARIHPAMSNSSLFGTELTDEFRELVRDLGRHIVFDAERCQAMMSTNLLAWVSCFMHRQGATLDTLATEMDGLRDMLQRRGRDVGFTGDARHVVSHAVRLLGPGLLQSKVLTGGSLIYRPVTLLPNVIELNYYANALLPVFALDAIVATSVQSVLHCDLWSYVDCDTDITLDLSKVMKCSEQLCKLLRHEFVLTTPCTDLSSSLLDAMDRLQVSGLLTESPSHSRNLRRQHERHDPDGWLEETAYYSGDSDGGSGPEYTMVYTVSPSKATLRYLTAFSSMLSPLLDAYCSTVLCLQQLTPGHQVLERDLVMKTQDLVRSKLTEGCLLYGESIAADPIKNCIKMLEGEHVLESVQQDSNKLLNLSLAYDSLDALGSLLDSINALRV